MKWLLVFVLFSDGSTDWEVFDLEKSGASCESAKQDLGERIKYGPYKGNVVVESHMECFATAKVER